MDSTSITTNDLVDGARPLIGTAQAEAVRLSLGGLVGRHLVIAESQPQISRGALGSREIAVLRNAMAAALDQKLPFVLLLDSAGAKIDEGVLIQGEFRKLLSDALAFHASGNGFSACWAATYLVAPACSPCVHMPGSIVSIQDWR